MVRLNGPLGEGLLSGRVPVEDLAHLLHIDPERRAGGEIVLLLPRTDPATAGPAVEKLLDAVTRSTGVKVHTAYGMADFYTDEDGRTTIALGPDRHGRQRTAADFVSAGPSAGVTTTTGVTPARRPAASGPVRGRGQAARSSARSGAALRQAAAQGAAGHDARGPAAVAEGAGTGGDTAARDAAEGDTAGRTTPKGPTLPEGHRRRGTARGGTAQGAATVAHHDVAGGRHPGLGPGRPLPVPGDGFCLLHAFLASGPLLVRDALPGLAADGRSTADRDAYAWLSDPARSGPTWRAPPRPAPRTAMSSTPCDGSSRTA
ncbi:hypothetical protein SAZ11_00490 [Streptomyces sp. FXJ1.4098]|nr:hypothetical protein [Streptomyces sp. FXJ1.4098]